MSLKELIWRIEKSQEKIRRLYWGIRARKSSGDAEAHYRLACFSYKDEKNPYRTYDRTINELEKTLELDQNFARAHTFLGNIYYKIGDTNRGRESFRSRSETQKVNGFVERAVAKHKKAIELDPECGEAYLNLGFLLYKEKKYDEAIPMFEKAMGLNPQYAAVRELIGAINKRGKKSVTPGDDNSQIVQVILESVISSLSWYSANDFLFFPTITIFCEDIPPKQVFTSDSYDGVILTLKDRKKARFLDSHLSTMNIGTGRFFLNIEKIEHISDIRAKVGYTSHGTIDDAIHLIYLGKKDEKWVKTGEVLLPGLF